MKIWELVSGIRIPMTAEEHSLVEELKKDSKYELSERQQVIAQTLTNKGILIKEEQDGSSNYRINYRDDIWRD